MFKKRIKSIDQLAITLAKFGADEVTAKIITKNHGPLHNVFFDEWYIKVNATLDSGKNIQYKTSFEKTYSGFDNYNQIFERTELEANEHLDGIFSKIKELYPKVKIKILGTPSKHSLAYQG